MDRTDPYKYFKAALSVWIKETGNGHQKILALETGYGKSYISQLLNPERKKPIPFEAQVKISVACGYDYISFLNHGKELYEQTAAAKKIVTFSDIEKKHRQTITQFQDKETALEFNKILIEIENKDSDQFYDLFGKAITACKKLKNPKQPKPRDTTKDGPQPRKTGTDGDRLDP